MDLDKVMCLPLPRTAYVESSLNLILDDDANTQKQLLKHLQNVCIVYACLAVKRNAGVVGTDAKYKAAAKSYKDIAVPGFFRWARDNEVVIPKWLTLEKMGQSTMKGASILFTDGKKLWARFDQAMREMKRDYNPIWDRYVKGQPGGNLPSGQTGDDAIEYLLDGLYAKTSGSAERPVGEDELVEDASSSGGRKAGNTSVPQLLLLVDKKDDDDGETRRTDDGRVAEKNQQLADEVNGVGDGKKKKKGDGIKTEDGDTPVTDLDADIEQYPPRPAKWTHQFLLAYCFIGRPSPSEDVDLKAARRTNGPSKRTGKRKAKVEPGIVDGDNDDCDDDLGCIGAGSGGNLDSTAIRTFVGAGEIQSRAKVKREIAAVNAKAAKHAARQEVHQARNGQVEKLVTAVESLSASIAAKHRLDVESAARAHEVAAQARKDSAIASLRGLLEILPEGSTQHSSVLDRLIATYEKPLSHFKDAGIAPPAAKPDPAEATAPPSAPAVTKPARTAESESPSTPDATRAAAAAGPAFPSTPTATKAATASGAASPSATDTPSSAASTPSSVTMPGFTSLTAGL